MRSPATMLAERAARPAPADGLKLFRDSAQAQITEPVIDACLFSRPSSYSADAIASHSGPLGGMLLRESREVRAGGLPEHFLLAVTATQIIALRRTMKARRGGAVGEAGEEVARWERSEREVSWRDGGYLFQVVLVSASEREQIRCCVGKSSASPAPPPS